MSGALAGRRIVVTRARSQAGALIGALETEGAEVAMLPMIEVIPPRSWEELDKGLRELDQFDWLVLTSANTVDALCHRSEALGIKLCAAVERKLRVAVIGPATALAAQNAGLRVDLAPARHVAEALAASLAEHVYGQRVFYPRSEAARDVIPRELRAAGAEVAIADAYRTVIPAESRAKLGTVQAPDAIIFSSASTVKNFMELLGGTGTAASAWKAISIGPVTTQALRRFGWEPAFEASEPTIAGILEAAVELLGV